MDRISDTARMVPSGPPPPRPPEIFRSAQAAIARANDAITSGEDGRPPANSVATTQSSSAQASAPARPADLVPSRTTQPAPQVALGLQPSPDPTSETGQNIDVRA